MTVGPLKEFSGLHIRSRFVIVVIEDRNPRFNYELPNYAITKSGLESRDSGNTDV